MAEGFLKQFNPQWEIYSAGTKPAEKVNPYAINVMNEIGIDISSNTPKMVDQFLDQEFDYVITVCDGAKETCPMFTGKVKHRLHIGFEDPAEAKGSEEFILNEFRRIRDQIKNEFYAFYNNVNQ
jgi:Protein-tyrosine-phosphatase